MTKFVVGDLIDVVWNGEHRATITKVTQNERDPDCTRYDVEYVGRGCGWPYFQEGSLIGKNSKLVRMDVPTPDTYEID